LEALVAIFDHQLHSIAIHIITAPRNANTGAALRKIAALQR